MWPGLNAPLHEKSVGLTQTKVLPPDTKYQDRIIELRDQMNKRRGFRRKVHPLDRGWSSTRLPGQRLGPPDPVGEEHFEDFESVCLELKTVAHGSGNFGTVRRFSCLMAVGNSKGMVGAAVSRSPELQTAVRRAKNLAAKKLFFIETLDNRTIYQDFYAECNKSRVFARRAVNGAGLTCHRAIKAICQLVGIKDITVKVENSTRNYQAITKAFLTGLRNQETHQQLAERKRLHVVEFSKERGYMPRVVASPKLNTVRTEEEIGEHEILDVEELYGEGRFPWAKPHPRPFYEALPSWERKLWLEYPFRNHDQRIKNLVAEEYVPRWTTKCRREWAEKEHKRALNGEFPIPEGIGLQPLNREFVKSHAKEEE